MAIPTTGAVDSAITETFDFVFFEGIGGISVDVPYPWPISIAGRPFTIDLAHYQWQIPDMVRQAIDFSSSPGEQSFDTGGVWLRSNGDWSLGAGQEYHDASDSQQRLFHSSLGVDVWTKRQLSLLPDTAKVIASANSTLRLLPQGSFLYFMDGQGRTLKRAANPESAVPSLTTITGAPAANFVDLTTDGGTIYLAATTGIYKHVVSGTSMVAYGGAASTTVATILRFCDGWLLCGVANVLSRIDAAGALAVVKTHPTAGFNWTAIVGAPNGIFAGGQADDIAEIFHIDFDPTTGGLAVPIHAGELPRGEFLRSLAYYESNLLIGTSKGFRLGDIQADGSLIVGPLIATSTEVLCAYGESKFVWFGWSNYDGTHTGVGRANLAEFRSRAQPAYASDLMAPALQGSVTDVCRFNDRTYFAVSGSGFWQEEPNGNLVASGTVKFGKVEWGTFEPKTFLGLQLVTLPLIGQVSATLTDDAGATVNIGTLSNTGTTGLGVLLGAGLGVLSTFFEVELTLERPA